MTREVFVSATSPAAKEPPAAPAAPARLRWRLGPRFLSKAAKKYPKPPQPLKSAFWKLLFPALRVKKAPTQAEPLELVYSSFIFSCTSSHRLKSKQRKLQKNWVLFYYYFFFYTELTIVGSVGFQRSGQFKVRKVENKQ